MANSYNKKPKLEKKKTCTKKMENYSCSINNEHLYSIGTSRVRYAINYMYGFVKQFLASEASIIFGLWSHYTFSNSFLYMRLCIVNFVLMVVAKYLRYGKIASCGLVLFVRRFSSFPNKNIYKQAGAYIY